MMHYAQTICVGANFGSWIYQAVCSCGYSSWSTPNSAAAQGHMEQHLNQVRSGQIR